MKKFILAVAAVMVSVAAFAQGQVTFNNRVAGVVDARVTFNGGPENGQGVGAGYTAQLFGGPAGTPVSGLTALQPSTTFRTSSAAAQGYVNGVTVDVPGVASGAQATLVMRVYPAGGAFTNPNDIGMGESGPITITLGGGLAVPANLEGLNAFTVLIPEPSTIALAVLGGAALLFLRRRK
jgi:hypothetical protein